VSITIPDAQVAEMIDHAFEADPEECCGILFGRGSVVTNSRRVQNVHDNRARRYTMAPLELIDAEREADGRGEEFVAFYHSHPSSEAYPSETDVGNAVDSEWTGPCYVVVSLAEKQPVVRAFRISSRGKIRDVAIESDDERAK